MKIIEVIEDNWIERLGNPTEKLRGPLKKEIGYTETEIETV